VSRIFDALRRSEPPTGNGSPSQAAADGKHWQDVLKSIESRPEFLEGTKPLLCQPRPEEHLVAADQNDTPGQEEFRLLCHRLERVREQRALGKILVTSAIPKEGKTLVAINLAATLARRSSSVLLVDADMRHPTIHRALGLSSRPGLADFLEGRSDATAVFQRLEPLGFYYIASGHSSTNPAELLQKPKLRELMSLATAKFEWIIFDSPPLNVFADAHCLSTLVDAVLLVVREGLTSTEALEEARTSLQGAFVAGLIVNASTGSSRKYYRYEKDFSARAVAVPTQAGSCTDSASSPQGN
jgi:protein-tyrosine kinase